MLDREGHLRFPAHLLRLTRADAAGSAPRSIRLPVGSGKSLASLDEMRAAVTAQFGRRSPGVVQEFEKGDADRRVRLYCQTSEGSQRAAEAACLVLRSVLDAIGHGTSVQVDVVNTVVAARGGAHPDEELYGPMDVSQFWGWDYWSSNQVQQLNNSIDGSPAIPSYTTRGILEKTLEPKYWAVMGERQARSEKSLGYAPIEAPLGQTSPLGENS